jgi:hypothetical protein
MLAGKVGRIPIHRDPPRRAWRVRPGWALPRRPRLQGRAACGGEGREEEDRNYPGNTCASHVGGGALAGHIIASYIFAAGSPSTVGLGSAVVSTAAFGVPPNALQVRPRRSTKDSGPLQSCSGFRQKAAEFPHPQRFGGNFRAALPRMRHPSSALAQPARLSVLSPI